MEVKLLQQQQILVYQCIIHLPKDYSTWEKLPAEDEDIEIIGTMTAISRTFHQLTET